MKQEFAYPTAIRIINIDNVLKYYSTNNNQVTIQAISSDKIKSIPLQRGSAKWTVQKQSTKSGTEYNTKFSASILDIYGEHKFGRVIVPVLVILYFCDKPPVLIGSEYLPVQIQLDIDEYRARIRFDYSSFEYPPRVTIIE